VSGIFDESVRLAEALECALGHEDQPTNMTVPALAELPELIMLARRVEASAHAVEPSAEFLF